MKTDIMDLRLVGILGLVALGIAALVFDGELGTMLMVAVSAGIGIVIGWLFRGSTDKVLDEMEEH